jgi:hypothetical protein
MRRGNVLVFAPTIEKADEFAADLGPRRTRPTTARPTPRR